MKTGDEILFEHLLRTMPGDINERRALLNAATTRLQGIPQQNAKRLLEGLDAHLLALRELPLNDEVQP